jgi:hypothetical protein
MSTGCDQCCCGKNGITNSSTYQHCGTGRDPLDISPNSYSIRNSYPFRQCHPHSARHQTEDGADSTHYVKADIETTSPISKSANRSVGRIVYRAKEDALSRSLISRVDEALLEYQNSINRLIKISDSIYYLFILPLFE